MTPFHGGFGLLNYQDLQKPSYFAYQFLNRLGDMELSARTRLHSSVETMRGGVQALFWDFTITHPGPSVNKPGSTTWRTIRQERRDRSS